MFKKKNIPSSLFNAAIPMKRFLFPCKINFSFMVFRQCFSHMRKAKFLFMLLRQFTPLHSLFSFFGMFLKMPHFRIFYSINFNPFIPSCLTFFKPESMPFFKLSRQFSFIHNSLLSNKFTMVRFLCQVFIVTFFAITLSSCASYTQIYRDQDGRIYKVESKGTVRTVITEGSSTIEQDTKSEPLIKFPDMNLMKAND